MSARDTGTRGRDCGFTLVEILIAIVLVGILSAVVVVGVGRLTEDAASASCDASADAARTASNSFFVSTSRYPDDFTVLTSDSGGSVPLLDVPTEATVAAQTITMAGWTLAIAAGTPPTFTCSTTGSPSGGSTVVPVTTASTTLAPATTVAPATTTVPPTTAATTTTVASASNGVSVSSGTDGDRARYNDNFVVLTNTGTLTDLTVTISIARTPGIAYFGQFSNFWAGRVTGTHATTDNAVVYTFSIVPGTTIVPGTWRLDATASGDGTVHPSSGDMWSVTTTSDGGTTTLMGTF